MMQNSATSYVSNFGTELKQCFIRIPSSFAPKYDGAQKGRLEMSKKISLLCAACFSFFASHAVAQEAPFKVICIAESRFSCESQSGCQLNRDASPSVYQISFDTASSTKIIKTIAGKITSHWTARNNPNNLDKYNFSTTDDSSVLSLTNDRKKFIHLFPSGLALYNSDLNLEKNPSNSLGGQVITGSCITP